MTKTTVTNLTRGFRGFNAKSGYVELGPNQSVDGVEFADGERENAESTGYFAFGAKAQAAAAETAPGGEAPLPRNVPKLKKIAADEGIDLTGATTADAITTAIVTARAARAPATPPTPPADDLDNMSDENLRNTVAALTGKPAADYATTERDELLKLARGEG